MLANFVAVAARHPHLVILVSLVAGLGAVVAVALSVDRRDRHAKLLREAISKAGQTLDQSAREAEMDIAQFRRQVDLVEGSHKRLVMQPDRFWQWYGLVILLQYGLPKELRLARKLSRVLVEEKRMAKAVLRRELVEEQVS